MSARTDKLLAQLAEVRAELVAHDRAGVKLRARRDRLMARATAAGLSLAVVGAAAGVSKARAQQVTDGGAVEPVAARKPRAVRSVAAPAREAVVPAGERTIPVSGPVLDAHAASVRTLAHYGERRTAFVRVGRGVSGGAQAVSAEGVGLGAWETRTAAGLVADAARRDVARVYVYGGELGTPAMGVGVERARAFALGSPGDGWATSPAGHYVADAGAPVYRWTHTDGRAVEVHRLDTWAGGIPDAAPELVAAAWRTLAAGVARAFTGGTLLATPATTGRDLWARTIPTGKSYPVLSAELRELIGSTAGQGRSELLAPQDLRFEAPPARGQTAKSPVSKLAGLTGVDGRFMYAGLTWGLPVGAPELVRGIDVGDAMLARRSRWRITATVPAGWDHVGLLMAPDAGGWRYPATPGETFTTWADGAEVQLARRQGWAVTTHEGMTWAEGKPLNLWTEKLVALWAELRATGDQGDALAARMVRSLVLHAVGAFAARSHRVTRTVPVERAGEVPAGVAPSILDTADARLLVWEETQALSPWALNLSHPEWSAAIWARARVRLLSGPGGVGALALPAGTVVAFRTDALYVTGAARELVRAWPDDGKPGRFRVELDSTTRKPWPTTLADLFAIRDDERNTR